MSIYSFYAKPTLKIAFMPLQGYFRMVIFAVIQESLGMGKCDDCVCGEIVAHNWPH